MRGNAGNMGQVSLDGNLYSVKDGTIQRRNINPRAARFETGTPGYASFTQGSAMAWKGLRGGIGHKYQEGSGNEECYFSDGLDATHRSSIIQGPKINTAGTGDGAFGVAPVKIIDFGGSTYAVGNSVCKKWNTGTSAWDTADSSALASPLDAIVVTDSTDSYLIVSNATSARKTADGSSWSALSGMMGYMAYHDNRLCGIYGQTLYYSDADDVDSCSSSCTVAGEDMGTIHGLFTAKSQVNDEPLLCINATKGLFTFDFWVNQVYPYLTLTGHSNAGRAGMFWNSYIFISSLGGIKKIAGKLVTDIGPDQDDGLPSTYQGYVYDMCPAGDGSWMVFSVHNGAATDKSSLFKRHGTVGGNQQIYSTSSANTAITCVHYSPSHLYTNGRLWWGEGTSVKYCMFPDFNSDPTQISSYEYVASSGKLVYPIFAPMEAFSKTAIRVRGATKGCTSDLKFTIYYRTDANCFTEIGSNWTTLGTFTASPSPTDLDIASGAGIEFKQLQLAVAGETNSSTSTPELLSLELDWNLPTDIISSWTFPVSVTQNNAEKTLDTLYVSQAKKTLVSFYPSGDTQHGTGYWVRVGNLPESIEWSRFRHGTVQVIVEELIKG
jgi:hypothetical protein